MDSEASGESQEFQKNLERFCELVLKDPELHQKLRETADVESFVALTIRHGHEHGYVFTAQEVHKALQERRRAWLERWV